MRRYRQKELERPEHYSLAAWSMYEFKEKSYTRSVVREMIVRIKAAPENQDAMKTIHDFICWVDNIRLTENNPIKDEFVGNVVRVCDNLNQYLGESEEEETDV